MFRSFFGRTWDFIICFRDLLTFTVNDYRQKLCVFFYPHLHINCVAPRCFCASHKKQSFCLYNSYALHPTVYRPAQIIFKKLFEIKSRYDHPLGSSDLIGPTRKKPSKYCPIFAVLVSSTNQCVPNHLPKKERNLSLYVFRYFFLQSRT